MRFNTDSDTLFTAFTESVSKLTDEIVEMSEKTDKEDPDPETTKTFRMDRILRKWFLSGGGMGY